MIICVILTLSVVSIPRSTYQNHLRAVTGGAEVDQTLKRSYIIFVKAQDINKNVFGAKTPRDFWIADFVYSLCNELFVKGVDNTFPGFPFVNDRELVKKIIITIEIFSTEPAINEAVDKIMNIINADYPTDNIYERLKPYVNITDYAVDLIQKMYPKMSKVNIVSLLLRYGAMFSYVDNISGGKDIQISKTCLSIPPSLYHFYNQSLPKVVESFASPVNHTLDRFCSIFYDDMAFGAIGPFTEKLIRSNKGSSFIANPPYDTTTMNYVSHVIADNPANNYVVCLPCKDGGLFHIYKSRYLHLKDDNKPMKLSIDKLLRINTLTGILVVPAMIMFYWSYFLQKKQRISYDTIFFYYLSENIDTMEFMKKVKDILIKFAFGSEYRGVQKIYDIEEDKIMELYPMNGKKIIESLKISF